LNLFYKTPYLVRVFYPGLLWKVPMSQNKIYLTFDDGPIPEVTDWVLDTLKSYKAKATFFCVGDNIRKHPEIFKRTIAEGHSIGNHTYSHLNGWNIGDREYLQDVRQAQAEIEKMGVVTHLFRPPYGKTTLKQRTALTPAYQMIMWDVLSWDYERTTHAKSAVKSMVAASESGSIVLFHDSHKSFKKTKVMLPAYMKSMSDKGYEFVALPMHD
jgi:peptidoglycan-N-acetylglucosamine deacetylase